MTQRADGSYGQGDQNGRGDDAVTNVAKAYVHEMLDFNPMWDSPQIIRRRRELWGGEIHPATSQSTATAATVPHAPDAEARLRDRARQCLDKLQTEFYQLPEAKLRQYLRTLHSDRLPEYAAIAARLQVAADLRDTLLQAGEDTGDNKFAYSLQQSVVRPAAEGAALREQYIEAICDERRVRQACAMVQKYVTDHSAVYALERNWFDMLLDPANQNSWAARHPARNHTGRLTLGGAGKWGFVALIVLSFVVRLSSVISRNSRPSSPSHNVPNSSRHNSPHSPGPGDPSRGEKAAQEIGTHFNELLHPQATENESSNSATSPLATPQSFVERLEQNHPYDEFENHPHRDQMIEKSREVERQMLRDLRSRYPRVYEGPYSSDTPAAPPSQPTPFPPKPSSGRYP